MPLLLRLAPSAPDMERETSPRSGWTPVAESKRGQERSGGPRLSPSDFESALRPHLSAAFNLARWLTRSQADAEDVLQESTLRAFRSYDSVRPASLRAWL